MGHWRNRAVAHTHILTRRYKTGSIVRSLSRSKLQDLFKLQLCFRLERTVSNNDMGPEEAGMKNEVRSVFVDSELETHLRYLNGLS